MEEIQKHFSIKYYLSKIIEGLKNQLHKYNEHQIALGFAIGVFYGIMPTFGIGGIFSIITALLLRSSPISSILGTLTANPLTGPLFFSLSMYINYLILNIKLSQLSFSTLSNLNFKLLTGFVIVSLVFSIISYLITYKVVSYYISKRYPRLHYEKSAKDSN